jgi:2'-5' RNA ligase
VTTGQLSFPGLEPEPDRPRTDRLFFAIFPDQKTAANIAEQAEQLREVYGLEGRPLRPERFHITVNHLDDFAGVPERIVKAAREAASAVKAPPFEVSFDYAMSFKGRRGNRPFVLRGGYGLADLIAFQGALGLEMAKAGLGRYVEGSFTPHVTLLYDDLVVQEVPIEPIRWTVRELVLVHSLLGQGKHVALDRWSLKG